MATLTRQITVNELFTENFYKRTVIHYELVYISPYNPYRSDEDLLDLVYREIEHHFPPRDLIFDMAKINDYFLNGPIQLTEQDGKKLQVVRFNVNYHIPGS